MFKGNVCLIQACNSYIQSNSSQCTELVIYFVAEAGTIASTHFVYSQRDGWAELVLIVTMLDIIYLC